MKTKNIAFEFLFFVSAIGLLLFGATIVFAQTSVTRPTISLTSSASPANPVFRVVVGSPTGQVSLHGNRYCDDQISSYISVQASAVNAVTNTLQPGTYTIYAQHLVGDNIYCSSNGVLYIYQETSGGQSPQGVQPPQGGGQSPQGGGQSPQGGQSPAPTEKKRKKRKNRTSRSEGWNCCKNDWQFFTAGEGFAIRKKHLSQVISELSAIHKMLVSEKFAQSMQTKKREEILKLTSEIVKTSKQIIYEGTPKTTPQPTRERSLRIQASPHK